MPSCSDVWIHDPAINGVVTSSISNLQNLADDWGREASDRLEALADFLKDLYGDTDWTVDVDLGIDDIPDIDPGSYEPPPDSLIEFDSNDLKYTEPDAPYIYPPAKIDDYVPPPGTVPGWEDPGISFDFTGQPGTAPTLVWKPAPTIKIPTIRGPDAIVPPSPIDRYKVQPVSFKVDQELPRWTRPDPSIDISGEPTEKLDVKVGDPPHVSTKTITDAGTIIVPPKPDKITVPSMDFDKFGDPPKWEGGPLVLDFSGAPGAAPGVTLPDPAAPQLPGVGELTTLPKPDRIGPVSINPVVTDIFPTAPRWEDKPVVIDDSGEPGPLQKLDWGNVPQLPEIVVPGVPTWTPPQRPDLLNWTDFPRGDSGFKMPDMKVDIPPPSFGTLENGMKYEEARYSSADFDYLTSHVKRIMGGELGIPAFIWESIWARAVGQLKRAEAAKLREARRGHARLGWGMPGGMMLAAEETARQEATELYLTEVVEKAVQAATMAREDFWQAMAQGVALERQAFEAWNAFQARQLQFAIAYQEASIAVYNALVSSYNATIERARVQMAGKELELKGELAKLEEHRMKLEVAKIAQEIDNNRIQMYLAEWNVVKVQLEAYLHTLKAVEIKLEVHKTRLDVYRAQIETNNILVGAWAKEWDAYAAKLQAQNMKLEKFKTEAEIFAQRVQAYSAEVSGKAAKINAEVQVEDLKLRASGQDVQRFSAEVGENESLIRAFSANADAQVNRARVQDLLLQAHRLKLDAKDLELRAWLGAWDGYAKKIQGELGKVSVREAEARVFGAEVEAYKSQVQGAQAELGARVDHIRAQIDAGKFDMDIFNGLLAGERAKTERYSAGVQAAGVWSDAQRILLSAHEMKLKAKELETQAFTERWRGYGLKIDAQKAKVGIEESFARVFQAEVQAYEAAVTAARAAAEVGIKVEELGIDNARMDTERYKADWEGEKIKADTYESEMRGVSAAVQAQGLIVDAWAKEYQGNEARINAWAKEWDGYQAKMSGQTAKAQVFQSYAQVFGERVRGYGLQIDAAKAKVEAQATVAKNLVELSNMDVERFKAQWSGIASKINAIGSIYQTKGEVYRAQISGKIAKLEGESKRADIIIKEAELIGGLKAKEAELKVQQLLRYAQIQSEGMQQLGNIYAQLTASVYNATHVSAGVSSSSGDQIQRQVSLDFEC